VRSTFWLPWLLAAALASCGLAAEESKDQSPSTEADTAAGAAEPSPPVPEKRPLATELERWDGSVQLGLYGAQGSSRSLHLRLGTQLRRKADCGVLSGTVNYHRGTRESQVVADRLACRLRQEWLKSESPWTEFVQGSVEIDKLRPYDARITADTGFGYRFVSTGATRVTGRIGGGLVHYFGLPAARPEPEVIAGLDLEHRFSKRYKLKTAFQYARQGRNLDELSVTTRADWQILVSEEKNVSLNLSIEDRLRRWEPARSLNDLDYSITLLWKF